VVYFKEAKIANISYEEFNVGCEQKSKQSFIGKAKTLKKNFVYRVHDEPNGKKNSWHSKVLISFCHN